MTMPGKIGKKQRFCESIKNFEKQSGVSDSKVDFSQTNLDYAFCNEANFIPGSIPTIRNKEPLDTNKFEVAFVVGESNLLSMLPELYKHASVVICADINPAVNIHTNWMLKCLCDANSIEEYQKLYQENHPLAGIGIGWKGKRGEKTYSGSDFSLEMNSIAQSKVCANHFLSSPDRFLACKQAAAKLSFVTVQMDMFDPAKTSALSKTLEEQNAIITVMNVTNLSHYDRNHTLIKNPLFLNNVDRNKSMILYSVGKDEGEATRLLSRVSIGTKQYFEMLQSKGPSVLGFDKTITQELVVEANELIKKMAAEMKLEQEYIPKIVVTSRPDTYGKGILGNYPKEQQLTLQRGTGSSSDDRQMKESDKLWITLLKGMMNWWLGNQYFSEETLKEDNSVALDPQYVKLFIKNHSTKPELTPTDGVFPGTQSGNDLKTQNLR